MSKKQDNYSLKIPGTMENLEIIRKFVAEIARKSGFSEEETNKIELAVDEACSNIIEHAYGGEDRGVIECSWHVQDGDLTIVLRDYGQPFDPTAVPEPDVEADLEERTGGGLGLYFIHQIMDEVIFDFDSEAGNLLTLVKRKGSLC